MKWSLTPGITRPHCLIYGLKIIGDLGHQVGDVRAGAVRRDPVDQRGHVPAVLPDGVRRATVGLELEDERLEGFFERGGVGGILFPPGISND